MRKATIAIFNVVITPFRSVKQYVFPKPRVVPGMKRHLVSQVIELVKAAQSRSEKLNIIQTNMSPALFGILRLNFDDELQLDVDLDVKYRPRALNDAIETLNHSTQIWKNFTKESPAVPSKKNLRFKSMLERLEPREAELFIQAAKKQLELGLTKNALKKNFPAIFTNNNRSE